MSLTERESQVRAFLAGYIERHGRAPMHYEIAAELGVSSQRVAQLLGALERKGYVRLSLGRPWANMLTEKARKL